MTSNRLAIWTTAALALAAVQAGCLCGQDLRAGADRPEGSPARWLVLRPIPVSGGSPERRLGSPDEETEKRRFDEDLLGAAGGESAVRPVAGDRVNLGGREYQWTALEGPAGLIDLKAGKVPEDYSIAYTWGEIEAPEARKALLGVASDDAVKMWVNGKLAHRNWVGRPARLDDDVVPVELQKGRNSLLLKVQNRTGTWAFACRLLGPEAQAARLIAAARSGDLDQLRLLLERGVDPGKPAASGFTALQIARLYGRQEAVELLAAKAARQAAAGQADAFPPRERLVEELVSRLLTPDSPGIALLVAQDGKVLLEKAWGLASVEPRVPATPGTRFRIGSVTKQFTAAAILKLAEEGKLGLEDRLEKFMPGFPRGGEITIHHLLTHTSGIHSYTNKPDFITRVIETVKPEEVIRSFRDDPFDFDPGANWSYNNSGYFLLGSIIEKVSGRSYGEYLERTFFGPLGMKNTGVHRTAARPEREATGYSFADGKVNKAIDWDMSWAGAAGALYSTVGDLFLWNEAVFGGTVLRAESLRAAFTPVRLPVEEVSKPKTSGYGYGWAIQELRGVREISHGGGLQGFLSYLLRLPERNFTVAVLVNCSPPLPGVDPGALAREIAELYLGEKLPPRESPKAAPVPPEALAAIAGRYDYGGAVLAVEREGSRVFAQLTGQPRYEIFPRSESTFFWKVVEAEVTFVRGPDGKVLEAVHRQGGQTLRAPRLEDLQAAAVDPKVFDAYVGRYDYGGGKAILTVTREGDRLFAELTGQPKFEILPKSETEFFWKSVNARVTFVKDAAGRVTKAIHRQGGREFEAPRME